MNSVAVASAPMLMAVAVGGAIGALARYGVVIAATALFSVPALGVLAANVVGSLFMGAVVVWLDGVGGDAGALRVFLAVGVLGAFTTFSTFALDAVTLVSAGMYGASALYVISSVLLSIAALAAGMAIARAVL